MKTVEVKAAKSAIGSRVEKLEAEIFEGTPRDFTEYQKLVSRRRGLLEAAAILDEQADSDGSDDD